MLLNTGKVSSAIYKALTEDVLRRGAEQNVWARTEEQEDGENRKTRNFTTCVLPKILSE
jgi:hypothetical protein